MCVSFFYTQGCFVCVMCTHACDTCCTVHLCYAVLHAVLCVCAVCAACCSTQLCIPQRTISYVLLFTALVCYHYSHAKCSPSPLYFACVLCLCAVLVCSVSRACSPNDTLKSVCSVFTTVDSTCAFAAVSSNSGHRTTH